MNLKIGLTHFVFSAFSAQFWRAILARNFGAHTFGALVPLAIFKFGALLPRALTKPLFDRSAIVDTVLIHTLPF
jgi:hypothetical protein